MLPEPRATYRIQLQPQFGFAAAEQIVPYLAELGISHLYTSPVLQAVSGSTHGYDVVDPTRVNTDLGGSEAYADLCKRLQSNHLGQLIDLVPNHMAIAGRQNPWWWDVLENGPASRFATYFDVDWETSDERWPNKILLPVLGDHYGRVLEAGQFRLSYADGSFILHYFDHMFPIDPSSLPELLARAATNSETELLAFLAESHKRLPRPIVKAREAVERRHRDKAVLIDLLDRLYREEPQSAAALEAEIDKLNRDPDALDALIQQQNYRPAFWRTASSDLGYRRFFDINSLVGMRVEDPEVFAATHALPVAWAQQGRVQGMRVDHPDGLRDPAGYLQRLRDSCPEAWIVVEKILAPEEKLRADWNIAGTTGYDFLNLVEGLFIDPDGQAALTEFYTRFAEAETDFAALVRACKRQILVELLDSDLGRLASLFVAICEQHRRHRDYTRHDLRQALLETAACFPVYRSYVRAESGQVTSEDERVIEQAISAAIMERRDSDPELFHFLRNILLLRVNGPLENELAMRFQQLTAPAEAKGVEDTAFYRFHRLIALNEVGGTPDRFGVSVRQFHQACELNQREFPQTLLASSTHDSKRSGDVRSRLALLSEIPVRWGRTVRAWSEQNEQYRSADIPDRNVEYLFYQTLIGAWPISAERAAAYLEKAIREAKQQTSWTNINADYEEGIQRFVQATLADTGFCAAIADFVAELLLPGRINSLAKTLLKLTAPGVPDIYQGTELWDLSLVDPDNRRAVDFSLRHRLLQELPELTPEQLLARIDEGLPKLWLIRQALHLRADWPQLFNQQSDYCPVFASGEKADYLLAFLRAGRVLTLVPRLILGRGEHWSDTRIKLPPGNWRNILTGDDYSAGDVRLDHLLTRFPVALLFREED
jgi:(1->4)-alpha-D-glucan 1-alpha-D-glucosylmutase